VRPRGQHCQINKYMNKYGDEKRKKMKRGRRRGSHPDG
jgi:hypothetical protein